MAKKKQDVGTFYFRFLEDIQKGVDSGERQFFLYGTQVRGELFFAAASVLKNLPYTLALYLLTRKNAVNKVIQISGESFHTYRLSSDPAQGPLSVESSRDVQDLANYISDIKETGVDALSEAVPSSGSDSVDTSNAENVNTDSLNFMMTTINAIRGSSCDYPDTKIAVIFERFNWEAQLFSKQQHNFDLIKKSLWFSSDTQSRYQTECYFLLDDIDPIVEYLGEFSEDSCSPVLVSLPPVEEIKNAIKDTFYDFEMAQVESHVQEVAKASKTSQLRLRTLLNVLNQILDQPPPSHDWHDWVAQFKQAINYNVDEFFWKDIHIDSKTRERLNEQITAKNNDSGNGTIGFIMYGPPGTGKTSIAKVLANEYERTLISCKLADLKGEYVGHTANRVKKLFEKVRASSPALLFLDEVEGMFPVRSGSDSDSFTRDLVTQFLAETDGVLKEDSNFLIVGATNVISSIDPAILSRLTQIEVALPDDNCRREILESLLSENRSPNSDQEESIWSMLPESDRVLLVNKTRGCSGRDLKKSIAEPIRLHAQTRQSLEGVTQRVLANLRLAIASMLQQSNKGFTLLPPPNFKLDDVIGYEDIKEKFLPIKDTLSPDELKEYNLQIPNGWLLFGPPGNGKTFFINCIAGEYELEIVEVNMKNILESDSAPALALNDIFDRVQRYALMVDSGVMLFFDEFDALASAYALRDSFLKRIDSLRKMQLPIVLVAATNHFEKLDEAIIRPGRFDDHIKIRDPQRKDYFTYFEKFLPSKFTINSDDVESMRESLNTLQSTYNVSGLKVIAEKTCRSALHNSSERSSKGDIQVRARDLIISS